MGIEGIGREDFDKLVDLQIRVWAHHTKIHYISDEKDRDKVLSMAYQLRDDLEKFKKVVSANLMITINLMLGHVNGIISYLENMSMESLIATAIKATSQIKKGVEA